MDSKSEEPRRSSPRKATGASSRRLQTSEHRPAEHASGEIVERRYGILDNLLEGCQIIGYDWRYVYINDAAVHQARRTAKELLTHTMMEMYPGVENTDLFAVLQRCMNERSRSRLENQFVYPDGTSGWFDLSIEPVPEGLFILSIDISERKRAEEALRSSEISYRRLFEAAKDGILILDAAAGEITDVNPFLLELLGYSRAELLGRHLWELGFFRDIARNENQFRELQAKGYARYENLPLEKRNGERAYVEFVSNVYDVSGSQIIQCNIRDITGRKQAEEAVRDRDMRFRALIENGSDAITLLDSQGVVLYDSPSAPGLLGYGPQDWIGKEAFTLIHPDDLPRIQGLLQDIALTPGARVNSTFRLHHKSRAWLWIEAIATNLLAEPAVQAIVVNYRDISERKRAEQALSEREARYRALFEDSPISLWEEDFSAVKQRLEALRQNGITNFKEYFAAHPEVVSECAALVKVLDVNKATMTLQGANRKDDLLKDIAGALEGVALQSFQDELVRIAAGATSFNWNGLNRTLDGRLIDVSVNWAAAPGYEDSLSRVIVSMIDITERKRADAERQALVEIMQAAALISNLQGFLGVMHQSLGRVLHAENFFVIFRDSESGLFEEVFSVDQYDPPMPPSRLEKSITSYVFRTGEPLLLTQAKFDELEAKGEVELVGKNSASWLGAPLKTPAGMIGVIAVQSYDDPNRYSERDKVFLASVAAQVSLVIERKQAEEKLEEERILLRTLIDNLPDRVYVMDQQGRKIVSSRADWQAAGVKTMEDVIGKTDLETYPLELGKEYWAVDQRVMNSGTAVINHEEQGTDSEGNPVWILTSKVPLRDGQGNVRGLVGVGHDITARKRAEARIERQVRRLSALRAIDTAISSSFDLRLSLNILLAQTINELRVDAAAVLVLNNISNDLEYAAGVGFRSLGLPGKHVKASEGYAGQALLERRTVIIPNLQEVTRLPSNSRLIDVEEFIALFAVPLVAKGEVKGVLEVFHRSRLDPEPDWLDFMEMLAGQAAIAIDSTQLFTELQRSNMELTLAYDGTIEGWSRAMDLRDRETEGHTQRVTDTAVNLGRAMGLSEQDLTQVRRGALLHDIGKIGVPDGILLKPGPLTEQEWVIMKSHPTLAYEMLAPIRHLQPAINIPYCHHEKWDGSGYPRGLKGEQIPLVARMFAVVDVFDALTSDRPYRPAWLPEKARQYLREQAGMHFDPQIVELFLKDGFGAG